MKDENQSIKLIPKSLKKIMFVQFYKRFKLTYINITSIFLILCFPRFMVVAVYTSYSTYTSFTSNKEKETIQGEKPCETNSCRCCSRWYCCFCLFFFLPCLLFFNILAQVLRIDFYFCL